MIAIDTNVVIRFLTGDPPFQFATARNLVEKGVFVPLTVLLEAGWVLRSLYGYTEADAVRALDQFARLPSVEIEAPERLAKAAMLVSAGLEFADALHLAAAHAHDGFATFDRSLAKIATREGVTGVQLL